MSYSAMGRRSFGAGDECDGADDGAACGSGMVCSSQQCVCAPGKVSDPDSGACIAPDRLCSENQYWSYAANACMDNPTAEAVQEKLLALLEGT